VKKITVFNLSKRFLLKKNSKNYRSGIEFNLAAYTVKTQNEREVKVFNVSGIFYVTWVLCIF